MTNPYWLSDDELRLYDLEGRPERRSDYLSMQAWMHVTRPSVMDEGWGWSLDNKWGFAGLMAGAGVAIPTTLGLLHPIGGRSRDGRPLRDRADFDQWLRHEAPAQFVIKPIDGMASLGVVLVRDVRVRGNGVRLLVGDEERTSDWLLALQQRHWGVRGSLLQELAVPHPRMAELGFIAPHTVRVLTAIGEDGGPELIAAALFAGRSDSLINRWTDGGLSIGIDLEDGRLQRGRTLPRFLPTWFSAHPDNGLHFEGERLPGWEALAEVARQAALVTGMHALAVMELAVSERGPLLLEGNRRFGLPLLQVHSGGFLRGPFRAVLDRLRADIPDGSWRWAATRSHPARVLRRKARGLRRRIDRVIGR